MAEFTAPDDGLSPASRKILQDYAVEVPVVPANDSRVSFVARPPTSDENGSGFHFARPTLPRRAFTAHQQPRCTQNVGNRTPNPPPSLEAEQAISPKRTVFSEAVVVEEDANESEGSTQSPGRTEPITSPVPARAKTVTFPVLESSRTISTSLETGVTSECVAEIQPSETPLPTIPTKLMVEDVLPAYTQQPTDHDLFKLFLHRLKERDEAEANASKLRDELKSKLQDEERRNQQLNARLTELEQEHKVYETEKTAQKQLVERWKTKFGKVRGLMVAIAENQERLLLDRQLIRKEQVTLKAEKDQMHDAIHYLTESAKGIGKNVSQYKAQLTGVIHQFLAGEEELKVQLGSKDSKIKDMKQGLEDLRQSLESARDAVKKSEIEKTAIESRAKDVEQKIREELSRASLVSKDQDRARFEQEKHTLIREKQLAEGKALKIQKELETMKADLAEAIENRENLLTMMNTYKQNLENLGREHQEVISAHENVVSTLKEHQVLHVANTGDIQKCLAAAQEENVTLKLENTAIRKENIEFKAEKTNYQEENKALKQRNESIHAELEGTKAKTAVVCGENENLRKEIVAIKENISSLQAVNESLGSEIIALRTDNTSIKVEITATQEVSTALRRENVTLHAELEVVKAANKTTQMENAAMIARIAALQKESEKSDADEIARTKEAANAEQTVYETTTPPQPINAPGKDGDAKVKKEKHETIPKGILKEVQKEAATIAKRTAQFHTPSRDTKKRRSSNPGAAPRRQSRVSSRFFDPQPTPSPSLSLIRSQQDTTWTVNQSVDTFMTQSSVQNRKRRREETFNNRFSQKFAIQ